jgi:hypothetical protein
MHVKNTASLSVRVALTIVLSAWLLYTGYWFVKSTNWWPLESSVDLVLAIVGTVGLGFRIGAVSSAILAFASYLKGKETSNVLRYVRFALLLETPYFLSFIPSAVFGFAAGSGLALGYHTLTEGGLWFIFETAIPTLVESIIMPASLLKLRSKLKSSQSRSEITKWACITGLSYLVVFWLTYLTQWIATFLQPASYASAYPGYGLGYVLDYPLNTFTFILTGVGLPLLIAFFVWSSLPAMRNSNLRLDLRNLGLTITLLGAYFITVVAVFAIFGAVGGASIWIIFFMFNNPDLWCITLPILGIPLVLTIHPSQKQTAIHEF